MFGLNIFRYLQAICVCICNIHYITLHYVILSYIDRYLRVVNILI